MTFIARIPGFKKIYRLINTWAWKRKHDIGVGSYGNPKILDWGEGATLRVGKFCSFAKDVTIFLGGNHRVDWITTFPFPVFRKSARQIKGHPSTKGNVIIGHDVWIGDGAAILSGVIIGNGAVVGARSVVTKNVPPYAIVAGNPATIIRHRFTNDEIAILMDLKWWDWSEEKLDSSMEILLNNCVKELKNFSDRFDEKHK